MNLPTDVALVLPRVSRREMLRLAGTGFGSLGLPVLFGAPRNGTGAALADEQRISLSAKSPHFEPKAKSVILLMQNGGPSQMDLFDPKPTLHKQDGKRFAVKVETFEKGSEENIVMESPWSFQPQGQCGMELSELIPNIGGIADEICLVRSMQTTHNSHPEALMKFMTGNTFQGRPTFGSWICYALGTNNQNLPANVVLRDSSGYPENGTLNWTSGWLPALYRGTEFSTSGTPLLNLNSARPVPKQAQRERLRFLEEMNRLHQKRHPHESVLETRIQNHGLAGRMRDTVVEMLDLDNESAETRKLYGLDHADTQDYGLRCTRR